MTNDSLLKTIVLVMDNRGLINLILDELDTEQLKKGILVIPESLINHKLKSKILEMIPTIRSYNVSFSGDSIMIDGTVNLPKIVSAVNLKYMLKIQELDFGGSIHKVTFTYMEDTHCENTMAQMALSAFKMKSTLAARGAGLLKKYKNHIYVTDTMAAVDLDGFGIKDKIPDELNLSYISATDGKLRLKFWLT